MQVQIGAPVAVRITPQQKLGSVCGHFSIIGFEHGLAAAASENFAKAYLHAYSHLGIKVDTIITATIYSPKYLPA